MIEELRTVAILKDNYTPHAAKIAAATDNMTNKINSLGKAGLGMGLNALKWGLIGLAGIVTAVGAKSLQAASEFETFNARLLTLSGSSKKAGEMLRWAMEFAKTTPYELNEVIDAMVRMQAYGLKPMGGELLAIGDFAAAMGRSMTDAVEAVADARQNEWERMKQFAVRREDVERLAPGAFNKQGQMVDRARAMTALFQIMQQRGAGGMARMMDTIAGKWSNLKDAMWQVFLRIGNILAGPAKGVLDWVIKKLEQVKVWIDKHGPEIKTKLVDTFKAAVLWAVRFYVAVRTALDKAIEKLGGLQEAWEKVKSAIHVCFIIMGAWIGMMVATNFIRIATGIWTIVTALRACTTAAAVLSVIVSEGANLALVIAALVGGLAAEYLWNLISPGPGGKKEGEKYSTAEYDKTLQELWDAISGTTLPPGLATEPSPAITNPLNEIAANTSEMVDNLKIMGGGAFTRQVTAFERFRLATAPGVPGAARVGTYNLQPSGGYSFSPNIQIHVSLPAGAGPIEQHMGNVAASAIAQAFDQLGRGLGGSARRG